jgi:hypothetical protein
MLSNVDGSNLDLTRIVAKSIQKLSPSTPSNFKYQEQQEMIMNGVFSLLQSQDNEVLNSTMEALIKIVELNYEFMQPYLNNLFQMTNAFM